MKNNDLEKARRYFQICFELRNKLKEMQASDTLWAQIISKKRRKGYREKSNGIKRLSLFWI